MTGLMTGVLVAGAVMLVVASALLLVRLIVGPTILDRSMALDVLVSVTVCAVALYAAQSQQTHVLPVLLVLAGLGFVGSVAVARYASGADDVEAEREESS